MPWCLARREHGNRLESAIMKRSKSRTHMSIWEQMGAERDEVAERLIKFVSVWAS